MSQGTALRRDAADNHRRLLDAAVAEFNEHGMDACVEQIAARAGVGVGTFYRRFGTKDALIDQLVEDLRHEALAYAQHAVTAGSGDGLEDYLRRTATALAGHRGYLGRMWSDHSRHADKVRPLTLVLLHNAQAQGRIRAEVTPNDVSVLLWSLRSVIEIAGPAAEVATQRHLDFALAGMRPGAEVPRHTALSDRAWAKARQGMSGQR